MLLTIVLFVFGWLLFEFIKLSLKVAWGIAKVIAWMLSIVALPLFVILAVSAGGFILLLPVGLLAAAFGILLIC